MRILLTGSKGNLGNRIVQTTHQLARDSGFEADLVAVDIDEMDITDRNEVMHTFDDVQPHLVIHTAALTNVDYCAAHPDEALHINGFATQTVALACQKHDAALAYISTNEVFGGTQINGYLEYDQPAPPNPYGYSKWVGERVVRDLVKKHYIIRTSWLFAHTGHNFVQTIMRLMDARAPLRVVTNEIGSPTYSLDLVAALMQLVQTGFYGIFHLTNEGFTSRYQFARTLLELSGHADYPIEPIAQAEYQRVSRPPEYAALRNSTAARLGIRLRPWQAALQAFLAEEMSTTQAAP